jgi:hypothetical protein
MAEYSPITIDGCRFENSKAASGYGGSLLFSNSAAIVRNSAFNVSTSVLAGGAIYSVLTSKLHVEDSTFTTTRTTQAFGGAITADRIDQVRLSGLRGDTVFSFVGGGMFYASKCTDIFIENAYVRTGLASLGDGGAMYVDTATALRMNNVTIEDSVAGYVSCQCIA